MNAIDVSAMLHFTIVPYPLNVRDSRRRAQKDSQPLHQQQRVVVVVGGMKKP